MLAPERKFAFVLLTNSEPGGALLASAALSEALTRYPGLERAAGKVGLLATLNPSESPTVELEQGRMREFAGNYREPNASITIRAASDGLRLTVEHERLPAQIAPQRLPRPADRRADQLRG